MNSFSLINSQGQGSKNGKKCHLVINVQEGTCKLKEGHSVMGDVSNSHDFEGKQL